eukprot:gene12296-16490_t
MLWQVLFAPFFPVTFRDGYIGDLLTSLVRVLIPFSFSLVYLIISIYSWLSNRIYNITSISDGWWRSSFFLQHMLIPYLSLIPLWIRLMQCLRRAVESGKRWPHYGNALKYTSAIAVISFGTFQPQLRSNSFWLLSFVGATLFQFAWDITQDWGIILINNKVWNEMDGNNFYLLEYISSFEISIRSKRLLGPFWQYIALMCGNLILRFAWTLTLLPPTQSTTESLHGFLLNTFISHIGPFVAAGEIIRRMVWGFFRLEYEQVVTTENSMNNKLLNNTSNSKKYYSHSDVEEDISNDNVNPEVLSPTNYMMERQIEMQKMDILSYTNTSHNPSSYKENPFVITHSYIDWTYYFLSPVNLAHVFDKVMACFVNERNRFTDHHKRVRLLESFIFAVVVGLIVTYSACIVL